MVNFNDESALIIDERGWCLSAEHQPSPNANARPANTEISLLVIHNISLPPGCFGGPYIEQLFANTLDCDSHPYFNSLRDLRVSSHFFIRREGHLIQFVSLHDRAWHAGVSEFKGVSGCNDFSIGIELEGDDFTPFTDQQYRVLVALTCALQKYSPLIYVAGHEHVAPGRKTDPGPCFDWITYQQAYQASYSLNHASQYLIFPTDWLAGVKPK